MLSDESKLTYPELAHKYRVIEESDELKELERLSNSVVGYGLHVYNAEITVVSWSRNWCAYDPNSPTGRTRGRCQEGYWHGPGREDQQEFVDVSNYPKRDLGVGDIFCEDHRFWRERGCTVYDGYSGGTIVEPPSEPTIECIRDACEVALKISGQEPRSPSDLWNPSVRKYGIDDSALPLGLVCDYWMPLCPGIPAEGAGLLVECGEIKTIKWNRIVEQGPDRVVDTGVFSGRFETHTESGCLIHRQSLSHVVEPMSRECLEDACVIASYLVKPRSCHWQRQLL